MIPAHAAFQTGDAARVERRHRAVPELELAPLERAAEIAAELAPVGEPGVELTVEHLDAAFAGVLGLVHGGVGAGEQRVGRDVAA